MNIQLDVKLQFRINNLITESNTKNQALPVRDLLENVFGVSIARSVCERRSNADSFPFIDKQLELTSVVSESIAHKNIVIIQKTFT